MLVKWPFIRFRQNGHATVLGLNPPPPLVRTSFIMNGPLPDSLKMSKCLKLWSLRESSTLLYFSLSPSAGYSLSALFSPYYSDILYISSFQLRSPLFSPHLVRRIRYCFFLCFFRAANPLFSTEFPSPLSDHNSKYFLSTTLHNNQWFHPIRRKIRSFRSLTLTAFLYNLGWFTSSGSCKRKNLS